MASATPPAGKSPRTADLLAQEAAKQQDMILDCPATNGPSGCGTRDIGVLPPPDHLVGLASKKRSRTSYFKDGNTYHCLILTNFDEGQKEMVKDSIVEWMAEYQENMDSDDSLPDDTMDVEEVDINRVRILLSEEERKAKKTIYREGYVKRPAVIEKRKAKENDPEQKKKREAYSKDPAVRERKKHRTKVRQFVTRDLKKQNAALYHQLEKKAEEALKRMSEDEPPAKRQKVDLTASTMEVESS